jgi:pseudaminic acid synthase
MSGNHQGSLDSAIRFVRKAKQAGADLLKVQVYRPDTITVNSDKCDFRLAENNDWSNYKTLYALYEKAHTPWEWVTPIFAESRSLGLEVFASPFDVSAVEFLEKLDCPCYKIASPEITDVGLIEACARTGKPVIISTGLASKPDLDEAVSLLHRYATQFVILKCVSAYPTPIASMNLSSIPWLREIYKCPVGLSDHTIGPEACFAAAALGAVLIEKHFRLEEDCYSVDAAFSMSLDHLPALKRSVYDIFLSLGAPTLEVPDVARPSLTGRRSLYAVENIAAGELFTKQNVRSIRPSFGLHPRHLQEVLGKTATRSLTTGDRISWDVVDQPVGKP